eukprot:12389099-Ditylum_brightwellii.AAC.1
MYTSALFGVDNVTQTSDADPDLAPFIPEDTSSSSILCAVADEQNINLTRNQMELLAWHWRWNHLNMRDCQALIHPTWALD